MDNAKKINRSLVFLFIVTLIPFFSIYEIKENMGETFYQLWQILSAVFLFYIVFKSASAISINKISFLFMLYQFVILASTVMHHGYSIGIVLVTLSAIFVFFILQSEHYRELLEAICLVIILSAIINFPMMLVRLNDENAKFFIGGKNALGMFLVPGMFLLFCKYAEFGAKSKKNTFFLIGLCLFSVLIGSSGTGIIVSVLATVMLLLAYKHKPPKALYTFIIAVIYILFILFSDDFFSTELWLNFTDMLGKDSSLTSRTTIWKLSKDIISENWLLGAGRGTLITYENTLGERQRIYEAHNLVLEILMEGGIIALALYLSMLKSIISKLDMCINKNRIIFIALCIVLINGLTESVLNSFFVIIILGIACRYASENRGNNSNGQ